MLDITLISVGKLKSHELSSLANDYIKRLKPFAKLKVIEVEALSFSEKNKVAAKNLEGERIMKILEKEEANPKGAAVYLLAERGINFSSSPDLAKWLNKKTPLILILGGALGFSDTMYDSYSQISLSPLTFPHELARVVLLEQLYRAASIIGGKEYHY